MKHRYRFPLVAAGATVREVSDLERVKEVKVDGKSVEISDARSEFDKARKIAYERVDLPPLEQPAPEREDFGSTEDYLKASKNYERAQRWKTALNGVQTSVIGAGHQVGQALHRVKSLADGDDVSLPEGALDEYFKGNPVPFRSFVADARAQAAARAAVTSGRGLRDAGKATAKQLGALVRSAEQTWVGDRIALGLSIGMELLLRAHPQRVRQQHQVEVVFDDGSAHKYNVSVQDPAVTKAIHRITLPAQALAAALPMGSGLGPSAVVARRLHKLSQKAKTEGRPAEASALSRSKWRLLWASTVGAVPAVGDLLCAGITSSEAILAKEMLAAPVAIVNDIGHQTETETSRWEQLLDRLKAPLETLVDATDKAKERRERAKRRRKVDAEATVIAASAPGKATEVLVEAVHEASDHRELAADCIERARESLILGQFEQAEKLVQSAEEHLSHADDAEHVADAIETALAGLAQRKLAPQELDTLRKRIRENDAEPATDAGRDLDEAVGS